MHSLADSLKGKDFLLMTLTFGFTLKEMHEFPYASFSLQLRFVYRVGSRTHNRFSDCVIKSPARLSLVSMDTARLLLRE